MITISIGSILIRYYNQIFCVPLLCFFVSCDLCQPDWNLELKMLFDQSFHPLATINIIRRCEITFLDY